MEDIQCFSKEVCDEINYYVYRLVDPRNGQTFYVGKGKGNRVFAHVNYALNKSDENNYINKDEDDSTLKVQTIREIARNGLKVIHIIHCWNIKDEDTAYLVESAIMDCYPGLTNIQKGHYHDYGAVNAYTLQKNLCLQIYDEPDNIDYILIKTSDERVNYCFEDYPCKNYEEALYEATRSAWNLNIDTAKNYKYVLSVIGGIVKEVYKVKEWMPSECEGRIEFEGCIAEDDVRNYFKGKRIPYKYRKRGSARPALYKQK